MRLENHYCDTTLLVYIKYIPCLVSLFDFCSEDLVGDTLVYEDALSKVVFVFASVQASYGHSVVTADSLAQHFQNFATDWNSPITLWS